MKTLANVVLVGFVAAMLIGLAGCAALRDELITAENAYEDARYDEARVWLTDLERSYVDMGPDMKARFLYLRGMTAYRLDQRNDALHYLALAREVSMDETTATLSPEQLRTMERTLTELTPNDASFRARDATSGGENESTDEES